MKKVIVAATVTALIASGVAFAASHGGNGDRTVAARQGLMKLYAHNLGTLGGMAKGAIEYDAATASAAAANLAALANMNQASLWAADTDSMSVITSNAKPELWENLSDAVAKAGALGDASTALAAVAGDGLDALRGGIGPVGQACGACHKAYRQKQE